MANVELMRDAVAPDFTLKTEKPLKSANIQSAVAPRVKERHI